ncbi:MAG: MFS transporter [Alphaproteobacteria bacterium]|nr:MFS transporter [Alphaproteobacteria bacterium]
MSVEKNLKLIGLFSFLTGCLFLIPVLLPYYKDHVGIGYEGLLLGEAAFSASCILFDVPTSWISDVWRRKQSLALGSGFICLGLCIILFAKNIWHVILAQIVWGVGFSLLNGTHTAMIYDSLLVLHRENEYRRWEGRRQAFSLYGIALAGTIGGFTYAANSFLPIYLSMAAQLGGFLTVLLMREPERHKQLGAKHPVSDIVETIKFVTRGHAELGIVIVSAAILFSATKIVMWSQQPYFLALHLPEQYYGVLMAVGWLLGGLSSHGAHLLDGRIKIFPTLTLAFGAAIIASAGAAAYLGFSGVAVLMIGGSCIFGMTAPRVNEAINRSVGSERRATALSTLSLFQASLFIPLSSIIGWISDRETIQTALFALALWLVVAGAGLLSLKAMRVKAR